MKKFIACLLALVMCVALNVTFVGAEVDFVPSISEKPAPELVVVGGVMGHVYDGNGEVVYTLTETHKCLVVTPVSEATTSTEIPDEAEELLLEVYADLSKAETKLSDRCAALNDRIAATLGEGKTVDDMVVRDLYDVTALCDDLKQYLAVEENVLVLTFDLGVRADAYVEAMSYTNGAWDPVVEIVNNGDGTVTVTFDHLCPVAMLVPAEGSTGGDVDSGDIVGGNIAGWSVSAAISLMAIVAVLVVYRRKTAEN